MEQVRPLTSLSHDELIARIEQYVVVAELRDAEIRELHAANSALLAERDALRRQLEWTAQYANESVTTGSRDLDDWIGDMQHIENSARAALGQGQEEA